METALVIVLDDAEPFDEVRREFAVWDVARGIPFHITLLWPFAPPGEIDVGELRSFFAAQEPFRFELTRISWWPRVVYAVPEPDDELRACMEAVFARFPEWPPYGGIHDHVVPHATLGHDVDAQAVRNEVERRLAPHLPKRYRFDAATLLEEFEPDRWCERERFPVGR